MALVDEAVTAYEKRFGVRPTTAALAPGRVEMMGNHTDYNGGFVLPAALDKGTVVVGSRADDDVVMLVASDFGREAMFSTMDVQADPRSSWASYMLGVVEQLQKEGIQIGGFTALIHSNVPGGAGLSSSAALEVATALFLQQLFPFDRDKMQIARLCQKAENEFVGVQCGILDQFSSVFGQENSLLFLDCLTLEHTSIEMGRDDIAIVICDSNVKHALTGGDYNTRRAECMAAAAHFGKKLLREVPWDEFEARAQELPANQEKRARHVLAEDRRVLEMRSAAEKGDAEKMGLLLLQGHASCRDLFQNSTPEIDALVEIAQTLPGCFGAKLTGGGWGGCTVNLVQADAVPEFCRALASAYKAKTGNTANVYATRAGAGAHAVKI